MHVYLYMDIYLILIWFIYISLSLYFLEFPMGSCIPLSLKKAVYMFDFFWKALRSAKRNWSTNLIEKISSKEVASTRESPHLFRSWFGISLRESDRVESFLSARVRFQEKSGLPLGKPEIPGHACTVTHYFHPSWTQLEENTWGSDLLRTSWWFQTCFIFLHFLGKWSNLTCAYFSNGLVNQPPTREVPEGKPFFQATNLWLQKERLHPRRPTWWDIWTPSPPPPA